LVALGFKHECLFPLVAITFGNHLSRGVVSASCLSSSRSHLSLLRLCCGCSLWVILR
jgi:hypothetical protein